MEYTVVSNSNLSYLIRNVNQCIKEGWQPQGGIHSIHNGCMHEYYQALIRKEPVGLNR